ncbi:MAG: hypothetical protein A2905_00435 [Candidatus Levybacteria bacterium RIFCSPLOWO2_01_FULL_36_10]|nr:MAG: hypothetical protein A2905_00435 [Candidatus Levybacteria bacterium RIFCSPLOWO2_01_FULL_36_10]
MRNKSQLLDNKYHGWYPTYRGKFLLLKNKVISKEAFILYEASVAFSDWDKEHKTYGLLSLSQSEIESQLGFSKGYVSRYGGTLIEKGLWEKLPDNIRVVGFELIEIKLLKEIVKKNKVVDLQKYLVETQQLVANKGELDAKERACLSPQSVADLQQPLSKSDIGSFKDKYYIPRTDEEYERMWKEGNYQSLTPDDMKWLDNNISEN